MHLGLAEARMWMMGFHDWRLIMTLFRNRYRVESTRLRNFEDATARWYHIVVCTRERRCFCGEVADERVRLSRTGAVAKAVWWETLEAYPRAEADAFVVMPNHVHLIVGRLVRPGASGRCARTPSDRSSATIKGG